jgi:amidase
MARHVDDLAYLLPVIAGPDGRDPFLAPTPLGDPKSVRLEDLHVAFYTDNGICAADPQIAGRVERCAEALAEAGARVTPAVPPRLAEATQLYRDLFWGWDGGAWVRRLLREAGTDERDSVLTRYLESKLETPAYLLELIDRWDRMRFEMTRFLEPFDVILAPVNAWTFVPHGGIYPDRYPGFTYPQPFSLTGWPVVAVPAGMASSGIPIAVQVVAKPWRDDVALAAARHLEQQCGGWIAPPI